MRDRPGRLGIDHAILVRSDRPCHCSESARKRQSPGESRKTAKLNTASVRNATPSKVREVHEKPARTKVRVPTPLLSRPGQIKKARHPPAEAAGEHLAFALARGLGATCLADKTNHASQKGLSLNRSQCGSCSTKVTTPRPVHKSSTDDLGPPLCQVSEEESRRSLWDRRQGSSERDGVLRRRLSFPERKRRPDGIVAMARRDSALEAFRHNPTDGSFAPPADRPSTYTKCPNLRFLSY